MHPLHHDRPLLNQLQPEYLSQEREPVRPCQPDRRAQSGPVRAGLAPGWADRERAVDGAVSWRDVGSAECE